MDNDRDRRLYSRLAVNMECNIYAEGYPNELVGTIRDVSESGMKILMREFPENVLHVGDTALFTACDEYVSLGDRIETAALNAVEIEVIRIEKQDNLTILGVRLVNRDKDYETYVKNSKVVDFLHKFRD